MHQFYKHFHLSLNLINDFYFSQNGEIYNAKIKSVLLVILPEQQTVRHKFQTNLFFIFIATRATELRSHGRLLCNL